MTLTVIPDPTTVIPAQAGIQEITTPKELINIRGSGLCRSDEYSDATCLTTKDTKITKN